MRKQLGIFFLVLCMSLGLWQPRVTVMAAEGKTAVSVSASTVNIGDTVTVTGSASGPAGEKVQATMTLSWDASVLEFVSCSTDCYGGGGSRLMNGDSFTITLKAISAGNSAVSMSASDGVLFDTVESLDSMAGSSTSVTVNNVSSIPSTTDEDDNNGGSNSNIEGNVTTGGNESAGGNESTGGDSANTDDESIRLSADNSLKSLSISPGTLSPSFSGNRTSYTATVSGDVSSIAVSAIPANSKAVVQSVTGNDNLTEGTNTITIIVKAENGVTATYTIGVTKQAVVSSDKPETNEEDDKSVSGEGETLTVDGVAYQISEDFSDEDIPEDFSEKTISYHGKEYKGVSYDKGSLNLLWMEKSDDEDSDDDKGKFFVYDENSDIVYPFVRLGNGDKYVIALSASADFVANAAYSQTSLLIEDQGSVAAYQETSKVGASDFYVFYGVNQDGTENWYQYDALEGTYQRFNIVTSAETQEVDDILVQQLQEQYTELLEEHDEQKANARNTIAVLIFVIAVLIVVIINLLIRRFRKRDDDDFFDEDFTDEDFGDGFDEDSSEEKVVKPKQMKKIVDVIPLKNEPKVEITQPVSEAAMIESAQMEKRKETTVQREESFNNTESIKDIEVIDFNDL